MLQPYPGRARDRLFYKEQSVVESYWKLLYQFLRQNEPYLPHAGYSHTRNGDRGYK